MWTVTSYSVVSPALAIPRNKHRSVSVCCTAQQSKHALNVPPFALVHPVRPASPDERWNIEEQEDSVKLSFQFPGLSKEHLKVEIDEDVLVVKNSNSGSGNDKDPYVRLLMTDGYNKGKVEAKMNPGLLVVTIDKVLPRLRQIIPIKID